jgi:hypothetical protein
VTYHPSPYQSSRPSAHAGGRSQASKAGSSSRPGQAKGSGGGAAGKQLKAAAREAGAPHTGTRGRRRTGSPCGTSPGAGEGAACEASPGARVELAAPGEALPTGCALGAAPAAAAAAPPAPPGSGATAGCGEVVARGPLYCLSFDLVLPQPGTYFVASCYPYR